MTTLWARMLIFKAWENGEITERCAHYFDELLNRNRFCKIYPKDYPTVGNEELLDYNSVLNNIAIKDGNHTFDIKRYIKKTSFINGYTNSKKTVYLSNLVNFEYEHLKDEIYHLVKIETKNKKALTIEEVEISNDLLLKLHNYLIETNFKTFKNEEEIETIERLINKKISDNNSCLCTTSLKELFQTQSNDHIGKTIINLLKNPKLTESRLSEILDNLNYYRFDFDDVDYIDNLIEQAKRRIKNKKTILERNI